MANVQHNSLTGADLHVAGPVQTELSFTDQAADPAAPAAGGLYLYSKSQGLYYKDAAGVVHPVSTGGFATPAIGLATAAAAGAASSGIRSDATIAAFDTTVPVSQAFGDAAATGSIAFAARRDHVHGMPANPTGLPLALTGATAATRYVGGTASGAPTAGTFAVGDFVIDQTGKVYVCTVAGTPGTWVLAGGGSGGSPLTTKGDLYGYSTAGARVPVGADGTVLQASSAAALGLAYSANPFMSGTAFPASPATNDMCFRTDRGLLYYYNGTRWLTVTLYRESLFQSTAQTQSGYSGDATIGYMPMWATTYDLFLEDFYASTYAGATNNATNYWTIELDEVNAANAATSLGTFNTSGDTAGNWATHDLALAVSVASATYKLFQVTITKTGTPGVLYPEIALSYRLIG